MNDSKPQPDPKPNSAAIIASPDAEPPFEKFDPLLETVAAFKRDWHRNRKDLKKQVEYERELAAIAALNEWTDQEIVNLLIAYGRKFGRSLQSLAYYSEIIAIARAASPALGDSTVPPLDQVNAKLGLVNEYKITKVTRYASEPAEYMITIANGESIRLGGVENIVNQRRFSLHLIDVTKHVPRHFKGREWNDIIQSLFDARVDESAGNEATDAGRARSWLHQYLDVTAILDAFDPTDENRQPFAHDGLVHVYAFQAREFVRSKLHEHISPKDFGVMLNCAGAEPIKLQANRTSRQPWKLPPDEFPAPKPQVPAWLIDREAGAKFISECLVIDTTASMSAADVREAYSNYCNDHHVVTRIGDRAIAAALRDHGCEPKHGRRGDRWLGVRSRDA